MFDSSKQLAQQLLDHRASHITVVTTSEQAKGAKQQKEILEQQEKPTGLGFCQETTSTASSHCHYDCALTPLRASTQQANPAANAGASRACYDCGETGHEKSDCPKARNTNASGVRIVLALGQGEEMEDPMVVTDTYVIEMENGKTESTNDIYSESTLTLDNHSFKIDLLPVSIKSFDIIICMEWLSSNRADILCYERVVNLNLPSGETLVVYGEKLSANLQIISCVKAQKYLRKEYHAFLVHVVVKKQEVKVIKDIPKVCNFPDIFLEDLPGVPPARRVVFRIDLIPSSNP
ncbi:uncharacterized protein LOC111893530 [Lactuca sativa]|uniref:uncharacterized protein LOC111893530 n=1 Tax=Lactuca sativa TaxID=4236 RepID=UPI000CD9226A|nr:uncharacterized protein LOC111893530 [Lactuca sativa]